MRIPNKFNGYSRDGIRLYNDPATVTVTLATMGETAAVAEGAATLASVAGAAEGLGALSAGAGALGEGMALGTGLYEGLGAATGLEALAANAAAPVASAFNPASYLASSGLGNFAAPAAAETAAAPLTAFQTATNQGILNALPQAALEVPAATPIQAMQTTANAVPDITGLANAENVYTAARPVYSEVAPGLAEGRGFIPSAAEEVAAVPVDTAGGYTDVVKASELGSQDRAIELGKNMTGDTWNDVQRLVSNPNWQNMKDFASKNPYTTGAAGLMAYNLMKPKAPAAKQQEQYIRPYQNTRAVTPGMSYYAPYSGASTAERNYFTGGLQALPIYRAASGGLTSLAVGGPIETMSAMNAVGGNLGYPQSQLETDIYSNPNVQRPQAMNMISPSSDMAVDPYTGEQKLAGGGLSGLGAYSDGGQLLKGPGDGVSDSIPASIGDRQPARLADGEFVVPARIVSEIGNGSTEAGARKLYAMMDRVQKARKKSTGKDKVAVDSRAEKYLPA